MRGPILAALWGSACALPGGCASAGPFIPDATAKIPPPSARVGADADDVFMRKPWEIWQVPEGTARYHREAFMLLPDEFKSFKVGDISVYKADGSDVRLDYTSIEVGANSQSQETISVFVYRAPGTLDDEWKSVVDRARRERPGAKPAEPFPLPDRHPPDTKQMAMIVSNRADGQTDAIFVQLSLFHQGQWAVRYEITCPLVDVPVAREKTRAFLASLRARE
jgi:hypothetical protein